jgi:hypothetical protein
MRSVCRLSSQLMQSNGGLKRLMQFIQDSSLPAVQAAAAKAIGRAARKRSCADESMMHRGSRLVFVDRILEQNRKIFSEQDAERAMICLLLSESDDVRIAACQALAVMAESMLSRETIRNNGASFDVVCRTCPSVTLI